MKAPLHLLWSCLASSVILACGNPEAPDDDSPSAVSVSGGGESDEVSGGDQSGGSSTADASGGSGGSGGSDDVAEAGGGMTQTPEGAGGEAVGSGGSEGDAQPALFERTWFLIGFEDPVGVSLSLEADGSLSGWGCPVWWPDEGVATIPGIECNELIGSSTSERDVSFSFERGDGVTYVIEAHVSEDGTRMTGTFGTLTGSLPYPVTWLPAYDSPWGDGARERNFDLGQTYLELTAGPGDAGDYTYGEVYYVDFFNDLRGDLGAFHASEVNVPEAEGSVIVAGPVVFTEEHVPVEVKILFEGEDLTEATGFYARMDSGKAYTFQIVEGP